MISKWLKGIIGLKNCSVIFFKRIKWRMFLSFDYILSIKFDNLKMKTILSTEIVIMPEGVRVTPNARVVRVAGKRGLLRRDFKHLAVEITVKNNQVEVKKFFDKRKDIAAVRTVASHIANMITGVTEGFKMKMKAVYAHFPINLVISDKQDSVAIRNFLGERLDRIVAMKNRPVDLNELVEFLCHQASFVEMVACFEASNGRAIGNDDGKTMVRWAALNDCKDGPHCSWAPMGGRRAGQDLSMAIY